MNEVLPISEPNQIQIIDSLNVQAVKSTLDKINQFQAVIQKSLKQNFDFGVVPGSAKPTLLKPGAEKILMMMGLRSEFEIVDSTRDFENGFFQYQVRCKLYKGDMLITEGLGACNTREKKYRNQDAFTLDNTVLKMAKKRALVDATLLVASLSDIFTQDLEDMDIEGNTVVNAKMTFDDDKIISKAQAKRLYALSNGNSELCKRVIEKYGYKKSDDIKLIDYDKIAAEIESEAKKEKEIFEDTPFEGQ